MNEVHQVRVVLGAATLYLDYSLITFSMQAHLSHQIKHHSTVCIGSKRQRGVAVVF
jgi:hypothetical protein